jgi:hypothetical protein
MAIDPDDSQTVYVGGDNCGVYVSHDFGDSWELLNEGLDNEDFTQSYYVDDFLILGDGSTAPEGMRGVYAATHGGIYFLGQNSVSWKLLTDYRADSRYTYTGGEAGEKAVPIPFSCLAYDSEELVIYAGTGHGRWAWSDFEDYYPQSTPDEEDDEYSLWQCSIASGNTNWNWVLASKSKGITTQIAVSHHSGISEVIWAGRKGLFSFETTDKTRAQDLWDDLPTPP